MCIAIKELNLANFHNLAVAQDWLACDAVKISDAVGPFFPDNFLTGAIF